MNILERVQDVRSWRNNARADQLSVGFVPTMGALHAGHTSLIQRARRECDCVALSIFVNPTQFNDPKDLENYPRPLERDLEVAAESGVDLVFLPQSAEIYSDGYRFQVQEGEPTKILCGATRPGHFTGVLTVVLKLLQIMEPDRAYFGEKDYQQFLLIRDMAKALFLPCEIVSQPTLRESDGLALSSRNVRLTPEHRRLAPMLYRLLRSQTPLNRVRAELEEAGFRVDYLEEHFGRRFAAVFLGDVRLIDNV